MSPTDPVPPRELLAHAARLRRLATALVRDAGRADDLVQRTWLRALERPPHQRTRLGSWLRTVLRNEARQHHRSDRARRRREAQGLPAGRAQAADEALARSEQLQALIGQVRALPEPYRTPMLLRWVDGHEPGATGEQDADVVVRGRRVRFRIVDETGEPVPGAGSLTRFNLDKDIPDGSARTVVGHGRGIQFWGEAGQAIEIAASVSGHPHAVLATTVPQDAPDAVHDVVLRPATGAPATLKIELRKPNGTTFRHFKYELETKIARSSVVKGKSENGEQVVAERPFEVSAGEVTDLVVEVPGR